MARPKAVAGELVLLQTCFPTADATALDSLARATGEAKAAHVRRARRAPHHRDRRCLVRQHRRERAQAPDR
jgi:hypothetical protein